MRKITLSRILLYPIKGLDAVEVEEAQTTPKGSLLYDRFIALFDEEGKVVSCKREKRLHLIRASYDLNDMRVTLSYNGMRETLSLDDEDSLSLWFSEVLGYKVSARKNENGFPDDRKAHGPTLVSVATLREVALWFGLSEENIRRRFRSNLEIDGVPPFWEDSLVGEDSPVRFRIGGVIFEGEGISKRCPVPTRDPDTGEAIKDFVKTFTARRRENLPSWSPRGRFKDTFYRLCVNTSVLKGGKIRYGDELIPLH